MLPRSEARRKVLCCGLAALLASTVASALSTSEYQLKAVFLFNFAQFVEWPASAFRGPQDPIVVCVLGEDPFGSELDAVMSGEQVGGRSLVVQRYERIEQIDRCHLLFVGQSDASSLQTTLQRLQGRPILTVGETSAFTEAGGMIRFVMDENRIRLQVNARAADAAQLRLSSKLLRSSQIVAQAGG